MSGFVQEIMYIVLYLIRPKLYSGKYDIHFTAKLPNNVLTVLIIILAITNALPLKQSCRFTILYM